MSSSKEANAKARRKEIKRLKNTEMYQILKLISRQSIKDYDKSKEPHVVSPKRVANAKNGIGRRVNILKSIAVYAKIPYTQTKDVYKSTSLPALEKFVEDEGIPILPPKKK